MIAVRLVIGLAVLLAVSGCGDAPQSQMKGDPEAGAAAIRNYGCGTCHTIPGIRGANATAGPPLDHYARRVYVAGVIPNTPEHLVRWIQDPQRVNPRTAMPELGVTEKEARDIAAYLYLKTGGWE